MDISGIKEFLDQFGLGNLFFGTAIFVYVIIKLVQLIKILLEKNSSRVADDLHHTEMIEQMKQDIESTSRELNRMQSDITRKLQDITNQISNDINNKLTSDCDHLETLIQELHSIVDTQDERIIDATRRLEKIEQNIQILFQNDTNTYREGIESAYKRYVEGNEPISLDELKRVEDLYNTYREQNNGQSTPLLDTMISRIRNLPTVKRNHRGRQ